MQATKQTPGALNTYKIDKFAKTLINAVPDGVGYDAVLGDPLEIVLTNNPASVRVGDEIGIKVLANGHPWRHPSTLPTIFFETARHLRLYHAEQNGRNGGCEDHAGRSWMVRVQTPSQKSLTFTTGTSRVLSWCFRSSRPQ